jgi:superoxide dismutase, Cu-Zn family
MNRVAVLGILCAVGALGASVATSSLSAVPQMAKAELRGSDPKVIGTIKFTQEATGMHIVADLAGVKPGKHGLHIHQNATCGAPPFKEAGEHLDPYGTQHGCATDEVRHLGDLGNIVVGPDGKGHLDTVVNRISLTDPHHLILGKAVVLNAAEDDCKTPPAGKSGDRIACGLIK